MYVQARPLERHDAEVGYWFAASNSAAVWGNLRGKLIMLKTFFYTIARFWTSYWFENILGILSNKINLSDTYCSNLFESDQVQIKTSLYLGFSNLDQVILDRLNFY